MPTQPIDPKQPRLSWPIVLRDLRQSFFSCLLLMTIAWAALGWNAPAVALTQVAITDLSAEACPAEIGWGAVTSGGFTQPAHCFLVHGVAHNTTNKTVYDADVYGRIYDANGESVFQNRTRVGSIAEIPPGDQAFEIRISIPANQPAPLQLKQFKASGFSSKVKARF